MRWMVMVGLGFASTMGRSALAQPPGAGDQTILALEVQAQQEVAVLGRFSAEHRVRLEGLFEEARRKGLPTRPISDRLVDGKSRGKPEPELVAEAAGVVQRLETASRALTHAGRERLDATEIALGASILDRGATSAQLESVIRTAPANRPLTVALDVVVRLADRGLPIDAALAQVSGKLVSKASDGQIRALVTGQTASRGS